MENSNQKKLTIERRGIRTPNRMCPNNRISTSVLPLNYPFKVNKNGGIGGTRTHKHEDQTLA